MVLVKTLESPLDCKEIQPVHPKGHWSWIFIGRTDAEAETPILWPADVKNWLIGKDSDAGKDWRREEKETTEDEMVGWHQLFFQAVSVSSFHGCSHYLQWFWSPPKESLSLFLLFPHLFAMKWWDQMPWSSFSECWVLSLLFHSPLSLSSRGSSRKKGGA